MRQAMRVSPTRALPNVACCISMGRLAVFSDNKAKVTAGFNCSSHWYACLWQQRKCLLLFEEQSYVCDQVALVKDAREQAVIALQKDPNNDLAQHLMGRCR